MLYISPVSGFNFIDDGSRITPLFIQAVMWACLNLSLATALGLLSINRLLLIKIQMDKICSFVC